jgi:hypothetical protein
MAWPRHGGRVGEGAAWWGQREQSKGRLAKDKRYEMPRRFYRMMYMYPIPKVHKRGEPTLWFRKYGSRRRRPFCSTKCDGRSLKWVEDACEPTRREVVDQSEPKISGVAPCCMRLARRCAAIRSPSPPQQHPLRCLHHLAAPPVFC